MGVKKKAAEHGDRVRWGEQMGTIISTHESKFNGVVPPNFGVLPDEGPNHLKNWPKDQCVVLDDRPKNCPRCGVYGHRAQSCMFTKPKPIPLQDWDVEF